MKNSFIFALSICLSIQCFASSGDGAVINEAIIKLSDVKQSRSCHSIKKSSTLKPGFYIIDNVMYDVVENAALNVSLDEKNNFLPISIIQTAEIKPYIKDIEYHLTLLTTFKGARQINALTRDNIYRYIAIIVNDEVLIAARVLDPLSDSFYVTGIESLDEAKDIKAKIECEL